ncbi:hypothetical protein mRhiFer1_008871 [Rhinolophus ferrumequinum]|uniref:Uncharacterized protein n=1 Tax=Rhinolophus ferrumequinum TaxID=59479 RepID=A0A7J8AEK5_RHIFE|nr:hypothetical protein mRhiFer1_008871 [Rhinolophus ferrumequinum]
MIPAEAVMGEVSLTVDLAYGLGSIISILASALPQWCSKSVVTKLEPRLVPVELQKRCYDRKVRQESSNPQMINDQRPFCNVHTSNLGLCFEISRNLSRRRDMSQEHVQTQCCCRPHWGCYEIQALSTFFAFGNPEYSELQSITRVSGLCRELVM